jgi:hypothetical protein
MTEQKAMWGINGSILMKSYFEYVLTYVSIHIYNHLIDWASSKTVSFSCKEPTVACRDYNHNDNTNSRARQRQRLLCFALSFSLAFFSSTEISCYYTRVCKHGGHGLRASFFFPLSLVVIAFASYATASCLRANTKVVTNIRKKSNTTTLHSYSLFFFSYSPILSFFLDLPSLYSFFRKSEKKRKYRADTICSIPA